MAKKVYAFDPPSFQSKIIPERLPVKSKKKYSIMNVGLGTYYAGLNMRDSDVDRRAQHLGKTGENFLEIKAARNVEKKDPGRIADDMKKAQTERNLKRVFDRDK